MDYKIITYAFLTFLLIKEAIELYLDQKNRSYVIKNKGAVPKKFN